MHACHLVSDWFTDIQPFRCTYFSPDVCTVTLSYSTPYQLTNASTLFFTHPCANCDTNIHTNPFTNPPSM